MSFSTIYFGLAFLGFYYRKLFHNRYKLGTVLNTKPLFQGQILWEVTHSLLSIFIFALYGVLTYWATQKQILHIVWGLPTLGIFIRDLLIISLWNEIHFYAIHRALHHPVLFRRVHWVHHKSHVTTPLSTYSFQWVESTLLSSVMILAMIFWDFNFYVLLLFPFVSLMMNTIGHMNFTLFSTLPESHILAASRRHSEHHRLVNGNYGFLLPYLDKWLGTNLKKS